MFYIQRPNDVPGTWYSEIMEGFVHGEDNATPYPSEQFALQVIQDLDMEDPENCVVVYVEERDARTIEEADIRESIAELHAKMDDLLRRVNAILDASGIEAPPADGNDGSQPEG